MSSFIASFFQSSTSGTNSAHKTQTTTTETEATTTTTIPSNDSSNDLLMYMDTIQQQKNDDPGTVDNDDVEEKEIEASYALPVAPPKRYFATRLLPPPNHINATTTGSNNHPNKNRLTSQRSMSKLFTTLPTASNITTGNSSRNNNRNEVIEQIPTYSQMMIDMMEYIMYVILLETKIPKTIHEHYHHLMTMIQVFRSTTGSTDTTGSSSNQTHLLLLQPSSTHQHRFSNRMMMTAFTCDILQLCPSLQQQQEDQEDPKNGETSTKDAAVATTSAIELPPEGWMELKKRLYALKHQLLSIHANDNPMEAVANAALTTAEPVDTSNNHNNKMDEQLANHVMMTTDFDTVVTLLSVQEILASFREQLEDIKEELEENEEQQETDNRNPNNRINKLVETCVSAFMRNLSDLFPPSPSLTIAKDVDEDEYDDDDDYLIGIGEESERTKTATNVSTTNGNDNIPHELVSLALIELYSPKQPVPKSSPHHPTGKNSKNIVDRLLYDIQCIIVDNGTEVGTTIGAGGRFSYANLVDKVRSLLLKWSQSILDVPTLVRLGYGGVPSPIVEKDEDDVSSWGSNNNNNTNVMGGNDVLTSTTISVDERQQQQRRRKSRTSLMKPLNTGTLVRQQPQHRSYSITAEEHDIIARLAATETATVGVPTHQESVEVVGAVNSPIAKSKDMDVGMDDMVTTNQNEFEAESGTAELYPALNAEHKNLNNGTPVVRKVVKASRRLLTSFNFALTSNNGNNGTLEHGTEMTNNVRNDSMANRSFMFSTNINIMESTSKKRTASECLDANLSIAFDDATRPEIIRRRNNIWAMNQRMTMRMKQRKEQNTDNASPMLDITTIHNSDGNSKNENSLTQTTPSRNGNTMLAKSPTSSVKKQQRRTFFTEVEVQALMDGIQKYGAGKWSVIQKNDVRLQGRTPIQLKDKYRNIVSIISSSSLPPPTVTKD